MADKLIWSMFRRPNGVIVNVAGDGYSARSPMVGGLVNARLTSQDATNTRWLIASRFLKTMFQGYISFPAPGIMVGEKVVCA